MPRREQRTIGGLKCELETCPPRLNFEIFAGLCRQLGPGPAKALVDPETLAKVIGMETEQAAKFVFLHVLQSVEQLEPARLVGLADDLMVGKLVINGTALESTGLIDAVVPDFFVYLRILRWAMEFNFLPTAAGSSTSDGSEPPAPRSPDPSPDDAAPAGR